MSFMYKENKKGPKTVPLGTPDKTEPSQILLHLQQLVVV